jgi:hypothetical protein
MGATGAALLLRATVQFFGLQWRHHALRLALAAALYLALKWLLLRGYGALIVALVL